ncbi:AraC family transcriptional regulator [Streptomyces mobaraensis NBRC 13819 = DSM 40847]|uniref:AraC family transcriptional regulator n=2 Tax=Streptomyces mobaraensis TaxID=35621 RepID=A0A5N5W3N3_STRMB|nr:AraC family transcriptional regulator [Streptomyces mobaraensis]EME97689.1 AraC family transcriptional regulator [Streptomyces mobaraensis NBRC 13819 = DSM 40847]KAB7837770.1 AraC family transcriptional regulator [Streptomyces mobaraensis]QTT74308.1 AraC family transcriptional regulator [Streptomyces mobaraensis NBRC 13819 = DSM 40847]
MDPFDDLLRGVRANGAAFAGSVLTPPWTLRFTEDAYLTLCVPLLGAGWIVRDGGGEPRPLRTGEAAIVRGPEPFAFTDDPGTGPGAGGGDGPALLLAGAYRVPGEVPRRLLCALPPVAVVPDEHDCAAMRGYLEAQLTTGLPGRQIVVDRLLDWLLVCTLRQWFDRPGAEPPAWYLALGDDVAGPALRAMHDAPERAWTLPSLAAVAGVSRSTFAKRFQALLGEPPLTYLTEWRMALAADLLTEPGMTVAAVARRVGYADPFGFSAAFKRVRGISPSAHRAESGPPPVLPSQISSPVPRRAHASKPSREK